jgi:hypothetical protein
MLRLRFTSIASLALTLPLLACSSSESGGDDGGMDAPYPLFDAAEASPPPPVDAGPLWQPCAPSNAASCPSGLECLGVHTAPVDAYGTCVFTCAGSNGPACTLSGGTCACPLTSAGGPPGDCSAGNEAGAVTVCAPAGDGGPSGNNEVEDTGAPFTGEPSDGGVKDATTSGG